jgi:hypothetical protein
MHPAARTLIVAFCAILLVSCGSEPSESGNPPPPSEPPPTLPPPPTPGTPDLGVNASLNGRRPFPDDNAWNVRIDTAQVDANSDNLIASIGLATTLHPDWGRDEDYYGIPYVIVAGGTAGVNVEFDYADESDPGPYPVPANAPIEGGPSSSGDRHILIIGLGNMGEGLITEVAQRWMQSYGKNPAKKITITVIDRNAARKKAILETRYPRLSDYCEIIPCSIDLYSPEFYEGRYLEDPGKKKPLNAAFLCLRRAFASFSSFSWREKLWRLCGPSSSSIWASPRNHVHGA